MTSPDVPDAPRSESAATEPVASDAVAPEPTTPPLSNTDHDATEGVTWPVRVAAAWSWRLIVIAAAGYLLVRAISAVSLVAFALILSLFIAAILHPLERLLRRVLPGPKSLSAAIALLVGIAVLGGVGYFVASQIGAHSGQLGDELTQVVNNTKNYLQTGPLHLSQTDLTNVSNNLTNAIKTHSSQLVSGAIATVKTVADVAASLLLIILSTFFMLRDGELIWGWVVRLFPKAAHHRLDHAGHIGWHTFGGYMRGVVLIALFHGTTVTVLLLVLRVPLAVALGVVIFIGSFIPLIGLTVAGALCVAVTLLEHGLTRAIVVAVVIILLVQIESHVLQPVIMSRTVQVHPLAVAVSVLSGTALAGIPGALIAVPLVAFVNTMVRELRSEGQPGPSTFPVSERSSPLEAKQPIDSRERPTPPPGNPGADPADDERPRSRPE